LQVLLDDRDSRDDGMPQKSAKLYNMRFLTLLAATYVTYQKRVILCALVASPEAR